MTEKLGTRKKARIVVEATWTGKFPLHLLASDQAFIHNETNSRQIDDSLAPYVDAGEQTIELVKYADSYRESVKWIGSVPHMNLAEWNFEAWRDAGVKLTFVKVEMGCTKKYKQFLHVSFDRFPLDMLRYDCCFPASSKDAQAISDSLTIIGCEIRKAVVVKYTDTKRYARVWWEDRWVSFGGVSVYEQDHFVA